MGEPRSGSGIVQIITRMILGGAQETVLALFDGLRHHWPPDQLHLITGAESGPEGSLLEKVRALGVTVHIQPRLQRAISPAKDWRALRSIRRRLRKISPALVHTHSSKAGVIGRIAAAHADVPRIVHTIHGLPYTPDQSALTRAFFVRLERRAARVTDRLIVVGSAIAKEAADHGLDCGAPYVEIPSGFDVGPFEEASRQRATERAKRGVSSDVFTVGCVSRLVENKGLEDLLAATAQLPPPRQLILVGDGPLKASLLRRCEMLGIEHSVRWVGQVQPGAVPGWMASMDVMVLASLREGMPRVIPQALIAGTPVVVSDLTGAEGVISEETGWTVPVAKGVEGLVETLRAVRSSPDEAARRTHQGRKDCVGRFTSEYMVERTLELYRELGIVPESGPQGGAGV